MKPSEIAIVTAITGDDLDTLIRHWEVEANKWGLSYDGKVKWPAMYTYATHRVRHLNELRDGIATARAEMRQNIDIPLAATDNAAA